LDCKEESCLKLGQEAPRSTDYLCTECKEHFESLGKYLEILGLDLELDHHLVRGLDYYTKTVFEIQPRGEKGAQSTLGGGGRYDDLIEELGGKPTPAVGFATGIERVILNLEKQNIQIPTTPQLIVFVAYLGRLAKEKALEYVTQVRRARIASILASGGKSLKAQLRQANALGATYAIIIGEEEIRDGAVILRDMTKGEQQHLSFAEVMKFLEEDVYNRYTNR
jgi:histidyl-tRNA synthetase